MLKDTVIFLKKLDYTVLKLVDTSEIATTCKVVLNLGFSRMELFFKKF